MIIVGLEIIISLHRYIMIYNFVQLRLRTEKTENISQEEEIINWSIY